MFGGLGKGSKYILNIFDLDPFWKLLYGTKCTHIENRFYVRKCPNNVVNADTTVQ